MAEKLYKTVRDLVCEGRNGNPGWLLDLYCGVGGIGLSCASRFERVLGADEGFSSIRDAKDNARANRIGNSQFTCADVSGFLKDFSSLPTPCSLLTAVLDPPRAGCSIAVIQSLIKVQPQRIVYVSCDPSTLARDVKILCSKAYQVRKIQPVDLFPQSAHIESITVLEKRK